MFPLLVVPEFAHKMRSGLSQISFELAYLTRHTLSTLT